MSIAYESLFFGWIDADAFRVINRFININYETIYDQNLDEIITTINQNTPLNLNLEHIEDSGENKGYFCLALGNELNSNYSIEQLNMNQLKSYVKKGIKFTEKYPNLPEPTLISIVMYDN